MLSRLQELRKEEETLLRVKAALHEQLTRLKVEELALQSMIRSREEDLAAAAAAPGAEDPQQILGQMDNEAAINQTELQLSIRDYEEEMEEEEESDS
ncbi:snRNA-activating protein complex subunit 5 [Phasianus colchicus]|uniref:Small nuclear RNA activating complex polypeptide 5 n=1 Tax=Phasianus colchicus TaxID=9054 RepID=A0A669PES5_PHACC|nr:snRNA-activating protein complex subunit 5 [Phasianus colchicus]